MNKKNLVYVLLFTLFLLKDLSSTQVPRAPGQPSKKPISKQDKKAGNNGGDKYLVTVNKVLNSGGQVQEYNINVRVKDFSTKINNNIGQNINSNINQNNNREFVGATEGSLKEELKVPYGEWWD